MAATAAAAVASSFSTSMQSLNCIRSAKTTFPNENLLKISSSRMTQLACSFSNESYNLNMINSNNKWRVTRIIAAVAQEESTVVVSADEAVEENGGDAVDEGSSSSSTSTVVVNTKLYFGNLPYLCDSSQLAGIIQEYASPELIEVLYDRETGKSRGFAFVTMSSVEDCDAVIKNLDGKEYGGRILRVNYSDKPREKGPLYPETEYKLFVGNLSWSATAHSLIQAFQEYGNVVGARVLYDGETGRSRGYGFVSFENKAEMETALQALNGVELEGREMRISLAQGKKQ